MQAFSREDTNMAKYTVEDIEILRQKSGISYEEAINLLEYHNGSLARSLVDLEKNGRLREPKPAHGTATKGGKGRGALNTLFRIRVRLLKGDTVVANLSVLFVLLSLLLAPWLVVLGCVAALVMGYRIAIARNDPAFARDSLDQLFKHAGTNVKNTVFELTREFSEAKCGEPADANAAPGPQAAAPAPEPRSESPASGTTPVNVQFSEDGSVRVTQGRDGFHEAELQ